MNIDNLNGFLEEKVTRNLFTAGHIMVSRGNDILFDRYVGPDAGPDTIYNIESITKVMVTMPVAFKLIEQGKLRLDDRIVEYFPAFAEDAPGSKTGNGQASRRSRAGVTVRDLLNFTGGIPLEDPSGATKAAAQGDLDKAWAMHWHQPPAYEPGTRVLYSDVSCRILGRVLEAAAGMDLDRAAKEWVFEPLGMSDTTYRPPDPSRCADTGLSDTGRSLRGQLTQDLEHDMGEILGSDGLFSTARDMVLFSRMLLESGAGSPDGSKPSVPSGNLALTTPADDSTASPRIFSEAAVDHMIGACTNGYIAEEPASYLHYLLSGPKVWFWELAAAPFSYFGDLVSEAAVGKLGGAGTFLLIDPVYDLTVVYLTNYGQPAATLTGEEAWNRFHRDLDMMGLCNRTIAALSN